MSDARRVSTVRWLTLAMLAAAFAAARGALAATPTFPPIPLVGGFHLPAAVGLAVAAAGFALAIVRRRTGCGLAAAGLALLFLRDQHWLQPWAWQAFLLLLIEATFPRDAAVWQRRLAVSAYAFSAASKLDAAFADHLGWLLVVDGLAPAAGLDAAFWSEAMVRAMAWTLPAFELAAAAILVWRPRWGLAAATAMHAGLLLTLGPWGLNHHPGVLIWNGFFLVHVWVLFLPASRGRQSPEGVKGENASNKRGGDVASEPNAASEAGPLRGLTSPARLAAWTVLLLPALEPFSLYDHWPAWSVYSNRPAVVRLEVGGLPPVRGVNWVGRDNPVADTQILSLSGWSFETWRTPCYPQERFQLAVAAALIDRLPEGTPFVVRVRRYDADRRGGATEETIDTRAGLTERLDRYWLNTEPGRWTLPEALPFGRG